MRAVIASVLFNLELPKEFRRKSIRNIRLEKYGGQIKQLKDNEVIKITGTLQYDGFSNNPCFYINKELNVSSDRINDLSKEMLMLRAIVQNILFSFWLEKDNAITSDFSISKSQDNYIAFNRTPLMFSNSEGEFKYVSFTNSELEESFQWFEKLLPEILTSEEDFFEKPNVSEKEPVFINTNKEFPYQKTNRLQRAIRFITIARSDSFLPAKITFYISALESLLSLSNVELRMQVADRTARIIGDTFEEKVAISKIVGIAYSFRSSYIHGAVNREKTLKKTLRPYESVEELSVELDDLLRRLIKRFLTDLNYVARIRDEDFSLWISELLYK